MNGAEIYNIFYFLFYKKIYNIILWLEYKDNLNPKLKWLCLVFHKRQSNVHFAIQFHWLVQFQKHRYGPKLMQLHDEWVQSLRLLRKIWLSIEYLGVIELVTGR